VTRAGSESLGACGESVAGGGVRVAGGVAGVSDRANTSGVSGGVAEGEGAVASGGVEVSNAIAGSEVLIDLRFCLRMASD